MDSTLAEKPPPFRFIDDDFSSSSDEDVESNGGSTSTSQRRVYARHRYQLFYDDVFGAWPKGLRCQQVLRSRRSIRRERQRQRNHNRYVIHPFSLFRLIWIIFMSISMCITLVSLPVDLAFFTSPANSDIRSMESYVVILRDVHPVWYVILTATDIAYAFDMVLTFRTGYLDPHTDKVKLSSSHIARHYATTWLVMDLFAVCPYDEIYEALRSSSSHYNPVGVRVFRFLKVLSLLRLVRLVSYINEIEQYSTLPRTYIRMSNLLAVYLLMTHWNGCIQYMISFLTWYDVVPLPTNIWITIDNLKRNDTSLFRKYTRSIFRAVSHQYSVSYGAQPPERIGETWVVNVSMLFGSIMFAVFLASVVQVISTIDTAGNKYDEMVSELRQYLRFHHVPNKLQKRCLLFFEQKYQHSFYDEKKFIHSDLLSLPRREDIARSNCRELIEHNDLFKDASSAFISDLLSKLEFQIYFRGDFLFRAGRPVNGLCFIVNGLVHFRVPKSFLIMKTLDAGQYFGAAALLNGEKLTADVIAADMCDTYLLSVSDFNDLVAIYPDFRVKLQAATN